jgi:hypothetical protein
MVRSGSAGRRRNGMVFSLISDEMAKKMIMRFIGYPKSWA